MGPALYFTPRNAVSGWELWKTDGTEAGTVLVKDIVAGAGSGNPGGFVASGNSLFFAANNPLTGRELWRSDGTEAGTVPVKDICAGTNGSSVANLTALPAGLGVVFSANDGIMGNEIWVSDGSAQNTCRVTDIVPGAGSTPMGRFTIVGDRLLFAANDGLSGEEPWQMMLEDLARVVRIDVRPGGGKNPVNRKSHGSIPVAILSEGDFLAPLEIDLASITFGHTGFEDSLLRAGAEDVDGDGLIDLVCHFSTQAAGFQTGDTEAIMRGHALGGAILRGSDRVRVLH
jgi:ELWxxDGT repeat protein